MSILASKVSSDVIDVQVLDAELVLRLSDGRTVSAPLAWFPRLLHGTAEQRKNWRLIGRGIGIHWPDLDEDISVESLLSIKGSPRDHHADQFVHIIDHKIGRRLGECFRLKSPTHPARTHLRVARRHHI